MQEPILDDVADNAGELPVISELDSLKAKADKMGVKYHPSISADKLREKITAKLNGTPEVPDAPAEDAAAAPAAVVQAEAPAVETENQRKLRKKREASELVRIRVTCMNPNKKDWDGEIFTAANSTVGTFKKYVPFNADEGWHVPRIIYNMIVQRQCQVFVTKKRGPNGISSKEGKMIREFAVEVLPMLTEEELHDLAQRQAMAKSID
jgi:hypothetical protein